MSEFKFYLYVSNETAPDMEAVVESIKSFLTEKLANNYSFEVINILNNLAIAESKGIFATPMLVKEDPAPVKKVLGSLNDIKQGLFTMELV